MKKPTTTSPLPLALSLILTAALTHTAAADEASFRAALKTIPPKYFAEIPLANRDIMFRELATDTKPDRLDAKKGWLHFYSDGGNVQGKSMIWAKELPRTGKPPLMFIHMAKPFAGQTEGKPAADQTYVLEPVGDEWLDVTKSVIPAIIDMTMHFRTRREDTIVEVAPWQEFKRQDNGDKAYTYGKRTHDLRWNGNGFIVQEPAAEKLTDN